MILANRKPASVIFLDRENALSAALRRVDNEDRGERDRLEHPDLAARGQRGTGGYFIFMTAGVSGIISRSKCQN